MITRFAALSSLAFLLAACSGSELDGSRGVSGTDGDTGSGITPDGNLNDGSDTGQSNDGQALIDLGDDQPAIEPDCDSTLEIIVRDFNREHPDFGGYENEGNLFIGDDVRRLLVEETLGGNKKPVFKDPYGHAAPPNKLTESPVCVLSEDGSSGFGCETWRYMPGQNKEALSTAENFQQWYIDAEGVNQSFDKTLELTDQGGGVYVFDTDAFFPLGIDEGFGETMGDSSDNVTPGRNFLFTTEIHLQFDYTGGESFTFRGDDDLWVFINDKLALDLGSMHAAAEATIDFDAQAEALGIEKGKPYDMDIFHAERRWNGSNFRIETNISCFVPAFDGIVR